MPAAKTTDKTIRETQEERVDVTIPRGQANDDPNFFVSVNGKNYILPRGKTSRVPVSVAWEINRSFAAQEAMDRRKDALIEEGMKVN